MALEILHKQLLTISRYYPNIILINALRGVGADIRTGYGLHASLKYYNLSQTAECKGVLY